MAQSDVFNTAAWWVGAMVICLGTMIGVGLILWLLATIATKLGVRQMRRLGFLSENLPAVRAWLQSGRPTWVNTKEFPSVHMEMRPSDPGVWVQQERRK